jgi:hypothetical protein
MLFKGQLMNKLLAMFDVLQKGKELTNKEVWKNTQLATNLIASVLGSVALLGDFQVSANDLQTITVGIITVVGVINSYITAATSKSVGL